MELLILDHEKSARHILGSDIMGGQMVQLVVPAGAWQGSRLLGDGRFALLGTTMCPAFADQDLEMAGSENFDARHFPSDLQELIEALT